MASATAPAGKAERDNGNSEESDAVTRRGDEDEDEDEVQARMKGPAICSVDQSAITGESLAVDKYKGDVAYYTCGVKRGKVGTDPVGLDF